MDEHAPPISLGGRSLVVYIHSSITTRKDTVHLESGVCENTIGETRRRGEDAKARQEEETYTYTPEQTADIKGVRKPTTILSI